jgi:hypothetical protein
MTYKTAELEGNLLDAAVAKVLGLVSCVTVQGRPAYFVPSFIDCPREDPDFGDIFEPSTRWDHGGPILERLVASGFDLHPSYIKTPPESPAFQCSNFDGDGVPYSGDWSQISIDGGGPTPLIAAMRAFVAAKLGDEVDLP